MHPLFKIFLFIFIITSSFFILHSPAYAKKCCLVGKPHLYPEGIACIDIPIPGTDIALTSIQCSDATPNCDINTKQCCTSGSNCYPPTGIVTPTAPQNRPPAPNPVNPGTSGGRNAITQFECLTYDSNPGIKTALGCLSYYPEAFIRQILPWSVRLAGGVAFFLILLAALQYTTATGDPEKMKSAQELLTSAASGLIIIIFASVLLYTIGVDIFGLTSLGF